MLDDDAESVCEDNGTSTDGLFVQYPSYMRLYTLVLSPANQGVPCTSVPSIPPCYLQKLYPGEGFCVCIATEAPSCNCYA